MTPTTTVRAGITTAQVARIIGTWDSSGFVRWGAGIIDDEHRP